MSAAMTAATSSARRRAAIAAALLLTLAAAWFAPEETAPDVVDGPARAAPRETVRSSEARLRAPAPQVDVLAIRERKDGDGEPGAGLFIPTEWTPAAAEAAAAAPAPVPVEEAAPQAPPLPFRVMGRHEQAGQTVVFLQQNDRTHIARVGDTIGDTYKVEGIDGGAMTLRYIPLDQVQTLELGLKVN